MSVEDPMATSAQANNDSNDSHNDSHDQDDNTRNDDSSYYCIMRYHTI